MKTFDEYKESFIKSELVSMANVNNEINQRKKVTSFTNPTYLSNLEKVDILEGLKNELQKYIDRADEAATIDIGAQVSNLINNFRRAYNYYMQDYYNNFDSFIQNFVMFLDKNKKPYNRSNIVELGLDSSKYYGFCSSECIQLGLDAIDFECFRGKSPYDTEATEMFISRVNNQFGTLIPTKKEKQEIIKNREVGYPDKDTAFVQFKEMLQNSGQLMNGGRYYLLSDDEAYQESLKNCSSMKR